MGWTAVYGRISKDKSGHLEKVETQVEAGLRYAAEHFPGSRVEVYADNDLSGADPDVYRPDYDRLLHDIRAGHVDHVVCSEQNRLTRRPAEWEELVIVLTKAGIDRVHCWRTGTVEVAGSKLVGRILAAVDAEEVERLRARVTDRLRAIAEEGRPHGGSYFAYTRTVKDGRPHLEPDPERAEVVREAASRLLAGWSLSALASDLNARGIPRSRGGKAWTASSVRSLVSNPAVAGYRTYRGALIPGTWSPVLDPEVWYHVRHLLAQDIRVDTPTGLYSASRVRELPRRRYLLTGGLAVCAVCQEPLGASQRQDRRKERTAVYGCRTKGCYKVSILAVPLEDHVARELLRELDTPRFRSQLADDGSERTKLTERISAAEARKAEIAGKYAAGEMDDLEWAAARAATTKRISGLTAELASLPPREVFDVDAVRDAWGLMTLGERRAVVSRFVREVRVSAAVPGSSTFDARRVKIAWR